MFTKLVIFAAALILVGPLFAATAGSSGGGSSAPASSGASQSGSSGGGGHSGGGGGGGHFGGGGMGGRGAATSARGAAFGGTFANHEHASPHSSAAHVAKPLAGQHVTFQHSTFKMAGTDHHHHHPGNLRREPFFENPYVHNCLPLYDPLSNLWNDCYGPAKTTPDNGTHRRS